MGGRRQEMSGILYYGLDEKGEHGGPGKEDVNEKVRNEFRETWDDEMR